MGIIFEFLKQNIGTIVVLAILAAILSLVVLRIIRDKKRGVGACSCGCSNCPMSGKCHANDNPKT